MSSHPYPRTLALVGNYLPRKCGIATFCHDVHHSLITQYPGVECSVLPVTDVPEGYDYPPEVRFEIAEGDVEAYRRAADFINFSDAEVVSLQHEFGIYGGPAGAHILTLLRALRVPVVTHLHTVLERPRPAQRRVLDEIVRLSARLIVMTESGRAILGRLHGVPPERVDVIPHGIPDMPFVDPNFHKDHFGVEGRRVLLTFGLLAPNKGIDQMLRALPAIVREFPDVIYVVLGATHPAVIRREGERYRRHLARTVKAQGLESHVVFHDCFVPTDELKKFLGAADIYVTPYRRAEQITSGTLAYAFGCGKAVVSTPYQHAAELLADGRGVLVPFRDHDALAQAITGLLRDEVRRHAMRKQAYLLGREMVWSNVAHQYMESYQRARLGPARPRSTPHEFVAERHPLPALRLDHLRRLTDGVGLLHNATHGVPHYAPGYLTADNALALRLMVLLEDDPATAPEAARLQSTFAAFVHHAFRPESGRFHARLTFERQWGDEAGADEALGHAIWALGTCVGRSRSPAIRRWAAQLLDRSLPALLPEARPHGWALGLLGIAEYLRRLGGDRVAEDLQEILTQRLLSALMEHGSTDWPWFEPELTAGAAQLPQALLVGGRGAENAAAVEFGLRSLSWLMRLRTAEGGQFHAGAPAARRTSTPPDRFNQFPREAGAAVAACVEAAASTGDPRWREDGLRAFEWFLGRNDLGQSLYDPATGGCCDALHVDRLNLNQGAESTLAFVLARHEIEQMQVLPQPGPSPIGDRTTDPALKLGDSARVA